MTIRERIKKIIADHDGWSVQSVSEKAGWSTSTLYKFLNPETRGGIQHLTLEKAEQLAEALEVDPRWLFWGDVPAEIDPSVPKVWNQIPTPDRKQALNVLQAFAKEGKNG